MPRWRLTANTNTQSSPGGQPCPCPRVLPHLAPPTPSGWPCPPVPGGLAHHHLAAPPQSCPTSPSYLTPPTQSHWLRPHTSAGLSPICPINSIWLRPPTPESSACLIPTTRPASPSHPILLASPAHPPSIGPAHTILLAPPTSSSSWLCPPALSCPDVELWRCGTMAFKCRFRSLADTSVTLLAGLALVQ